MATKITEKEKNEERIDELEIFSKPSIDEPWIHLYKISLATTFHPSSRDGN